MNILKKIALTASVLTAIASIQANAAVIEFKIGDVNFTTEKDSVITKNVSEAAPFISASNRTMVPIRAISDAFGAETTWLGETQEVLVKNSEKEIKLAIGSPTAYVNNETITLDSAPVIVNDRTFVPLRFIGEALDYNVNYVTSTAHIVIDDTPVIISCGDKNLSFAEFKALYDISYQANLPYKMAEMSDEEYQAAVFELTLSNAQAISLFFNTFSDTGLSADDISAVKAMIAADNQLYNMPMEGLNSFIHERIYFASGTPVISYTAKNRIDEIASAYEKDYIRAKHILVEDENTANEVYEKAISGEDFDTLIKTYGTDPGMEANPDGYTFTTGMMVEEFETAAFALETGKISTPVKSAFGYHILKREALPEITDEIKNEITINILSEKLNTAIQPELKISAEELLNMLK